MTYDVRITPHASDDLEAAARWWFNNRSADQAFRWYQGFLDQLESLDEMPERCPLARENPRVPLSTSGNCITGSATELCFGSSGRRWKCSRSATSLRTTFRQKICKSDRSGGAVANVAESGVCSTGLSSCLPSNYLREQ